MSFEDDLQQARRRVQSINVATIIVEDGRREVRNDDVDKLAASMSSLGLRTPITVRQRKEPTGSSFHFRFVLVTGAHRLAAAKKLGWQAIDCIVLYGESDDQARLWEIAENLHRAELTSLERDEQIAEWVKITGRQAAQVAPTVLSDGRKAGPQHKQSGINAASRELGIERTAVQRAVRIASISPEAKKVAVEVGLDNNQKALLAAKDKGADPEKEVASLRDAAVSPAAKGDKTGAVTDVLRFTEPPPSAADITELKGAIASIGMVENRIRKIATPTIMAALARARSAIANHIKCAA